MARILVRKTHVLEVAEVRGRLERLAVSAQQRHRVRWRWESDALEVLPPPGMGQGARGRVVVGERDVRVEVELPLSLSPARGLVERRVVKGLDDLLR